MFLLPVQVHAGVWSSRDSVLHDSWSLPACESFIMLLFPCAGVQNGAFPGPCSLDLGSLAKFAFLIVHDWYSRWGYGSRCRFGSSS